MHFLWVEDCSSHFLLEWGLMVGVTCITMCDTTSVPLQVCILKSNTPPLFLPAFSHCLLPVLPSPPSFHYYDPFQLLFPHTDPITHPSSFSPFFPSVVLLFFLCTKCFRFIICILWCMGTIMFFIMEKMRDLFLLPVCFLIPFLNWYCNISMQGTVQWIIFI